MWVWTDHGWREEQILLDGSVRVTPTHEDWVLGRFRRNLPVGAGAQPLEVVPSFHYPDAVEEERLIRAYREGKPGSRSALITAYMPMATISTRKHVQRGSKWACKQTKEDRFALFLSAAHEALVYAVDHLPDHLECRPSTYLNAAIRNALGRATKTEASRGITGLRGETPKVESYSIEDGHHIYRIPLSRAPYSQREPVVICGCTGQDVRDAINLLPEPERGVMLVRHVLGRSQREAAYSLRRHRNTISRLEASGIASVKDYLFKISEVSVPFAITRDSVHAEEQRGDPSFVPGEIQHERYMHINQ